MIQPKIYIAGKLNDMACDYIKNVHDMIKNADEVRREGFAVFVPGIDLLCGIQNGNWNYEDYFDNSQPWLDVADGIYIGLNWRESHGTLREIKRAQNNNQPIFFKELNGLYKMKKYFFGNVNLNDYIINKPKDLEQCLLNIC